MADCSPNNGVSCVLIIMNAVDITGTYTNLIGVEGVDVALTKPLMRDLIQGFYVRTLCCGQIPGNRNPDEVPLQSLPLNCTAAAVKLRLCVSYYPRSLVNPIAMTRFFRFLHFFVSMPFTRVAPCSSFAPGYT